VTDQQLLVAIIVTVDLAMFVAFVYVVLSALRAIRGIERGIWAVVSQLKAEHHARSSSSGEVKMSMFGR